MAVAPDLCTPGGGGGGPVGLVSERDWGEEVSAKYAPKGAPVESEG